MRTTSYAGILIDETKSLINHHGIGWKNFIECGSLLFIKMLKVLLLSVDALILKKLDIHALVFCCG